MREWWRSAVIYQIYPRSFQDDHGDGIGTLSGITRRLEYVASLGVDVIWLSPFFTSPQEDMGYDIADQCGVDPIFGTLDDFDELLARAHDLGLKVIIDQVPSHTSSEHSWFRESRASRDNPKADWYVWSDAKPDGSPPNNWLSVFGGPAWTWDSGRRQYYMHSFLASQPQLNFHDRDVQDAVLDTMRFWLDRGVDGFRLDSINYPFHDARLRDNPPKKGTTPRDFGNPYELQDHVYDKTRPETVAFLKRVRTLCDGYGSKVTVGEVGEGKGGTRIMGEYTKGDDRLNMAYSFEMLSQEFSPEHFRSCIEGFFGKAPDGWPCWAFSNHDVVRHVSRWAIHGTDPESLSRLSAAILLSLEGAICLYQGEELGQTQTDLDYHEIIDPPGRKLWPDYKGRDGCRTPMVWRHDRPNAGFSEGSPWLPVKAPQRARSVDLMELDPGSPLHFYREMLAFRRGTEALREGRTEFIDCGPAVLAFRRGSAREGLLCCFNLRPEPAEVQLHEPGRLSGPHRGARISGRHLSFDGNGFAWIVPGT